MKTILPFFLSTLLSIGSHAANLYVDINTGNNANAGTIGSPFKEIGYAVTNSSANDIINVRAGTYTNHVGGGWKSGLTVQAYNGELVVAKPQGQSAFFYIGGALNVTISGIEIDGSQAPANNQANIKIDAGSTGITITNCNLHHTVSTHAILLAEPCTNAFIVNCQIHDISTSWDGGSADHGIYYSGDVIGTVIAGNTIYNLPGNNDHQQMGIHCYAGVNSHGTVITNNTIHNCRIGLGLNTGYGAFVANNDFYSNIIGCQLQGGSATNKIYYNSFTKNGAANGVGGGISIEAAAGAMNEFVGNGIAENIANGIYQPSGGPAIYATNNATCDNNTSGTSAQNWARNGNTVNEAGNLNGDSYSAGFNGAPTDLTISSSSSFLNAGITTSLVTKDKDGNSRPQGANYDIGAHERTSGATTLTFTVVANGNASEPSTANTFTVTRTPTTGQITNFFTVNTGTATEGADFSSVVHSNVLSAGVASFNVTIIPIDDLLYEGTETVILSISSDPNYAVGTPGSATMLLNDNDPPSLPQRLKN